MIIDTSKVDKEAWASTLEWGAEGGVPDFVLDSRAARALQVAVTPTFNGETVTPKQPPKRCRGHLHPKDVNWWMVRAVRAHVGTKNAKFSTLKGFRGTHKAL